MGTRSRILPSLVLAICLLALPQGAQAANNSWKGVVSPIYSTLGNWITPSSVPGTGPGETATFPGGLALGAYYTVVITASPTNPLYQFNFTNSSANPYTIIVATTTPFIFAGLGVGTTGTGQVTFQTPTPGGIIFGLGTTPGLAAYNNTGSGVIDFSAIGGAGTAITAGSIAGTTTGTNYNLGATALTTGSNNTSTTVTGVIIGAGGSLIKVGTGSMTLSGANTYTGGTTLTAGTLVAGISSGVGTGAFGTGGLTLNGGTLQGTGALKTLANNVTVGGAAAIGGTTALTLNGTVALGNALTVTNTAATILGGAISGAGSLTMNGTGTGTLTLNGANSYHGGTRLTSGTLVAGNDAAFGALATDTLTLNGGTLQASGTRSLANAITVGANFTIGGTNDLTLSGTVDLGAATRTITVNSTGGTTLAGVISNGSLTKAGTGSLTLSGANTYTGGTTLTTGILVADNDLAFGTGGLTLNGGTLMARNPGATTLANAVALTAGSTITGIVANALTLSNTIDLATYLLTINGAGNVTLSNVISGVGGSLTKAGTSTLTLSGANTYTGGTTLTAGTLAAGNNNAFGTGTLALNGGTLQGSGGLRTWTNNVTVGGAATIGGANALTLSGTVGLGTSVLSVNNTGATILSGVISSTGGGNGITVNNGAGSLTLGGVAANTYTGNTTLTTGTLLAGHNSAFGTGNLNINGGTIGASAATIAVANTLGVVGGNFNMGGAAGTNLELSAAMNLGTNTLTHNGASSDTLSGNVTNGNINVTAGTLTLSGAGANSANVATNGGTLNLNGAAGTTFTGTATVTTGTLNFTGGDLSGLLTLTGGNFNISGTATYSNGAALTNAAGATFNIATGNNMAIAGGLTNNGTATTNGTLTGNLTNNAGGFVDGGGTITGNLINNGTVNPGNSPGTLTVGTYTVNAGGTHVVEIASASSYDKLVATAAGGVTLNGGRLSPRLLGGYIPPVNQVFTNIISNTGGGTVAGTFASIDNTQIGNSRTLFWQALYNASSVDLQAVGNYTFADLSLSRNQQSVGNMLNALPLVTSGDLFEVLNAINALTTNESVRSAYNEISPQKYAALPTLTFPVTHLQFQYLQNHLARQRWEAELGSDVVSTGGGGFMKGFSFGYDNKMLLAASNMTLSDAGNPLIRNGVEHRWGIYLEPMANWGNLRPTGNMVGYRYKNFGFTLGADYWVMDNLLVGVNTGYSKTLTGIGGTGGDINANFIPFNAYSSFFVKGFYVNGTLGYTFNNYDMERNVAFGTINRTAKANTSGNQFQAAGETGYDFKVGNAIVGPTVSVQYATQTTGGFTESNAGALNLRVASQTADSLQTGVGARASYKAKVGNVTVKPQLAVVWQHEFSNNTRGVNARLAQGSATMNFRTDKIGQNFAVVSFDLPARISKNFVAHVGYTAEVGRSKSSNQGVNLGLKYEF